MSRPRPPAAPARRLALVALLTASAAGLAVAPAPAHAGRDCTAQPPRTASVTNAMALAERMQAALDASGARVVVLARAGQNLDAYGLRWSHLGYAYRAAPGEPWRVLHKLNACGTPRGDLYRQGLGNFFLDDLFRYEAAWMRLAPDAEAALLPVLRDDAQALRIETPDYSMVAYPWATRYQQSNQWAIELLAEALSAPPAGRYDTAAERRLAQRWLRERGYVPTTLQIGALQRLGARLTAGNVAFDDHPDAKRFAGRIETVTVDSVFAWLRRTGLGTDLQTVR